MEPGKGKSRSSQRTLQMRRVTSEPSQVFSHVLPVSTSQYNRNEKLPHPRPISPTPRVAINPSMQESGPKPATLAKAPRMYRLLDFFAVFEKFPNGAQLNQVYPSDSTLGFPWRLRSILSHLGCDGPCSVAISDSNQWFYCSALALAQEHEDDTPKVLCLVSRAPCLTFMEDALRALSSLCKIDVRHQVALEPFIRCLVFEVPSIPRDRTMRLCWEREHVFRRRIKVCDPRMKYLPFLDDRSFRLLFSLCAPEVIVSLLEHLLAENSVLLHATKLQIDRLSPLAEALRALVYPLNWQGLYIPFLPQTELHVLHSSVPYIAGCCCEPTDIFRFGLLETQQQRGNLMRVFVLNADTGEHHVMCSNAREQVRELQLPEPLRTNLLQHLDEVLISAKAANGSASPPSPIVTQIGSHDTGSNGGNSASTSTGSKSTEPSATKVFLRHPDGC